MTDLRDEFDAATRAAFAEPLLGSFPVERVNAQAWGPAWEELRAVCFPHGANRPTKVERIYTPDEREGYARLLRSLAARPLRHHLLIRDGDGALVGVVRGSQRPGAEWHMSITAIKPAYQGRGLYSALLQRLIALMGGIGFRAITSRHHADNNAVLVPKLKAGFIISGFDLSPKRGLMVELCYPLADGLRAAYSYRIDADRETS